jgi:hypothetical protein
MVLPLMDENAVGNLFQLFLPDGRHFVFVSAGSFSESDSTWVLWMGVLPSGLPAGLGDV